MVNRPGIISNAGAKRSQRYKNAGLQLTKISRQQRRQQHADSNAHTISQIMAIDKAPVFFSVIHELYKYKRLAKQQKGEKQKQGTETNAIANKLKQQKPAFHCSLFLFSVSLTFAYAIPSTGKIGVENIRNRLWLHVSQQ